MRRGAEADVYRCLIVLALSLAAACSRTPPVERVTVDELKAMLGRSDVTVVDVRLAGEPQDDDTRTIRGAVRESPNMVSRWMGKYPRDRTYVFYCA